MILRLTKKVLDGSKYEHDARSGLKVTHCKEHLIIYRHGELKLWVDTEVDHLLAFSVRTQAEVSAFNKVLELCNIKSRFVRSGRTILVEHELNYYRSEDYHESFGPDSRNYGVKRPSNPTPRGS
jgi:hypothetical protein